MTIFHAYGSHCGYAACPTGSPTGPPNDGMLPTPSHTVTVTSTPTSLPVTPNDYNGEQISATVGAGLLLIVVAIGLLRYGRQRRHP